MRKTQAALVATGFAAIALAGAGLAWACTDQANIYLSRSSGPPGTQVTVEGELFADSMVEIQWHGTETSSGTLLATAEGSSFSVVVTIPEAPEDTYSIYAVAPHEDGSSAPYGDASRSFVVTSQDPPTGEAETSGETAGGTAGRRSGERTVTASGGRHSRADRKTPAPASREPLAQVTDAGVVFGDSVASQPVTKAGRENRNGNGSEPRSSIEPASPRFAPDQLWSGFGPGPDASLLPGAEDAGQLRSDGTSQLALGIWLLGFGLVTISGGFAIADMRRRRAETILERRS